MVYQKTNFVALPCSCFFCPFLQQTTTTQGGKYMRSWYSCAILWNGEPFPPPKEGIFDPVIERHPACPLAEFR